MPKVSQLSLTLLQAWKEGNLTLAEFMAKKIVGKNISPICAIFWPRDTI
jgi:hypothetical protein